VHGRPVLPQGESSAEWASGSTRPPQPLPGTQMRPLRRCWRGPGSNQGPGRRAPTTSTGCSRRWRAIAQTVVEVGHVGVVISYTGCRQRPVGEGLPSRQLVKQPGERGVWTRRCLPGKYDGSIPTRRGAHGAEPPTSPQVERQRGRAAHRLRREPVRDLADHQGRVRAQPPAAVVVHIDYKKRRWWSSIRRRPSGSSSRPSIRWWPAYFKKRRPTRT